jgi:hypothetical protein
MRVTGKKAVFKMHLTLDGCVAIRFKMLTYFLHAALLNPHRRLALERDLLF